MNPSLWEALLQRTSVLASSPGEYARVWKILDLVFWQEGSREECRGGAHH